jgi:hypothetical protein
MEASQWNFGARTGLVTLLRARGWKPIAAADLIRFKRPIRRFERFTVETRYVHWDQKWIYSLQTFRTEKGLAAVGLNRTGYFDSNRVAIDPGQVMAALGFPNGPPPCPGYISAWNESEADLLETVKILN